MKVRVFLFIVFLLMGFISSTSQVIISGKVLDENERPLEGASVYLNNTSVGTYTNDLGEFKLLVTEGFYDLIVSFIGYQAIQYQLDTNKSNPFFLFKATPISNILDEIVITNKKYSAEERAYFLTRFKKTFIGESKLSKECIIENPHVINFRFDKSKNTLKAYAYEPIKITNKGLGYQIEYNLIRYDVNPEKITYMGYTRYTNLEGNKRKNRKWKKNRVESYLGSIMHFLRVIQKDDLSFAEEGFFIDEFKRTVKSKKNNIVVRNFTGNNSKVTSIDNFDTKSVSEYRVIEGSQQKKYTEVNVRRNLFPSDLIQIRNGETILSFSNFLKVKYTKEPEEYGYRPGNHRLDHQSSIISLLTKNSTIDENGTLIRPLDLFIEGYWSYEKMANALPLDYNPKE